MSSTVDQSDAAPARGPHQLSDSSFGGLYSYDDRDHQSDVSPFAQFVAQAQPATAQTSAAASTRPAHHLSGFAAGSQPRAQDLTFARLASDVYNDAGTGADGWHRLSDDEIRGLGLDPARFHDAKAHFKAAIYTDGKGHYAVAFRGTHPMANEQDWRTSGTQALGFQTRAYKDAINLGQAVSHKLGADKIVMVGHSLGGGLAGAAALGAGSSAVTFNSSGLSDATIRKAGWNPEDARHAMDSASRSYSVDDEILTGLQDASAIPPALGHHIRLRDPEPGSHPDAAPMLRPGGESYGFYFAVTHSVWLHDIGTVIESMQHDPRWAH